MVETFDIETLEGKHMYSPCDFVCNVIIYGQKGKFCNRFNHVYVIYFAWQGVIAEIAITEIVTIALLQGTADVLFQDEVGNLFLNMLCQDISSQTQSFS